MLPFPVKFREEELPTPSKAPEAGQHTEEVLRETLGYDESRLAALREAGALG
jgi:crotonobetainyl-CoA:carnitine CoA-transferase CaiB-like acyl-CoA transferase